MHKTSFNSLQKKLGSPAHFQAIKKFITEVTKSERVLGVILFGSLAKGEFLSHSDIDILVIYKDRVDFLENNLELRRLDDSGLIEPFGYGYEQLKGMIEEINPFIWDVFEEGLILYAADDEKIESLEKLRDNIRNKYKVEKSDSGWRWMSGI